MKKYYAVLLVLFGMGSVDALPLYNPVAASLYEYQDACCQPCDPCTSWKDRWSWGIGFVRNNESNHKMAIDNGAGYDSVPLTVSRSSLGEFTLNFAHRVEIFGQLGTCALEQDIPSTATGFPFNNSGITLPLVSDAHFAWAVGGRATLIEWGPWGFGVEGQYFQYQPNVNSFSDIYTDESLKYREWQVGFGLAYHVCKGSVCELVPYFGARVGGTQIDAGHLTVDVGAGALATLRNQQQECRWGTAVGITALVSHRSFLNFEWDFLNANAAVINFHIGF